MIKAKYLRIIVVLVLSASLAMPAYAAQKSEPKEGVGPCEGPSAEAIIADTLILRPVGIVAMVVGFAGAIIAFPFAILSNSTDRVKQKLLVEPFEYTFKRPVGDTSLYDCSPQFTYNE